MSYAASQLTLIMPGGQSGPVGFNLWLLDTLDTAATVDSAGYVSDATTIGMQKGDVVLRRTWTSALPTTNAMKLTDTTTAAVLSTWGFHIVFGITSGAADLTDALAGTMTNTD